MTAAVLADVMGYVILSSYPPFKKQVLLPGVALLSQLLGTVTALALEHTHGPTLFSLVNEGSKEICYLQVRALLSLCQFALWLL